MKVRRAKALGYGLLLLLVSACGSSISTSSSAPTFTNPVYRHDYPDPFVLRVGTTYYAYATNVNGGLTHLPVLTSHDLVHWRGPIETMPTLPKWTLPGDVWAPSVLMANPHRFVMYYVSHDVSSGKQCIGEAAARAPTGPFRDASKRPFICALSGGGAIDPTVFEDSDGRLYLYWKNDGNSNGAPTHVWVQRLSHDGLRLLSPPSSLAVNDQQWEGAIIEGPTMWKHGSTYFLFYSGGDYASAYYAVGYSTCRSALGPCTEYRHNPVLKSRCKAAGPGGETITTDRAGRTWMVYHAWLSNAINTDQGRVLWLDRLNWPHGRPSVHGPTCTAQAVPKA